MKLKKLLASILCVAMVLSTMSFSVFANEESSADVWDGTANTEWYADATLTEYELESAEELAGLAELVNGGNTFEGVTIKLAANIDLAGNEWAPIGGYDGSKFFSGTFDGQGHIISNMTITKTDDANAVLYLGLFSYIQNATLKNIVLENVNIDANSNNANAGALVLKAAVCNDISDISVLGANINVVSGNTSYTAGVVGYWNNNDNVQCAVKNVNMSDVSLYVKANNTYVGGMFGYAGKGRIDVTDCEFEDIEIETEAKTTRVGGVFGYTYKVDPLLVENVTITDLDIDFNYNGTPSGESSVGGVTGCDESPSREDGGYKNVSVSGTIDENYSGGSSSNVGGFIGISYQYPHTYTGCTADVDVISRNRAGGFAGAISPNGWQNQIETYINCTAQGDASGPYAGGFVGCSWLNASVNTTLILDDVTAEGTVTASIQGGGLIGSAWGQSNACSNIIIRDSVASEIVTGSDVVGGVVGASSLGSGKIIALENVTYTIEPSVKQYKPNTVVNVVAELWRVENGAARNVELVSEGKFATLQEAIEKIGEREGEFVIKVLVDIEQNATVTMNANQQITIIGEGDVKPVIKGQLNINAKSNNNDLGQALTIKNLAFDIDGATNAAIFNSASPSTNRYASNVTIDECDFYGSIPDVPAIRTGTNGCKNWTISNSTVTGIHSLIQTKGIDGLVIDNCTLTNCDNGINLDNSTNVVIKNSTIDAVDGCAVRIGENGDANACPVLTLENNTITSTEGALVIRRGAESAIVDIKSGSYSSTGSSAIVFGHENKPFRGTTYTDAEGNTYSLNMTISGGEYSSNTIDVVNGADGVATSYEIEEYLEDGLTLSVNEYGIYIPVADDAGSGYAVTENITVSLEPTENANKYDVVLKADVDAEIHRFLSAELNITLTPDDKDKTPVSIKNIVGNEQYDIEVIKPQYNANEIWGFHLGEATDITVKDFSGSELTIATIELTGYGEGELTVAAHEHNKVQAIQSKDNNNVKFYTVDAATLVLPTEADEVNLEVPTKNLTIEITFVNPIEDNDVAYQDMTVTVEGKDIETKTINLGEDGDFKLVKSEDGKIVQYIILVEDYLTENNSYNITVTGAGYRTADYRVTMTEDKIVYFWNNATKEDNKKEIEIGVSKPVTATFLAGDIAEDNIIDKYDLAAVVSYFGKYKLNVANAEGIYENAKYAKYDLNRDGNIDSEDIAYVLASFGY